MNLYFLIIGGFFLVSIAFDIAKGRIRSRRGHLCRSASPVLFWLMIAMKCVIPVVVIFPKQTMSLVQYGIEDTSTDTGRKVEEFQQRRGTGVEPETNEEAAVESQDRPD